MGERKFPQSRKFVMLVGDILIMIGSYCLATAFILNKNILAANFTMYSDMMLVMIVINGLLFNINGLYSIGRKRFAEIILSLLVSMLGTAVIMMALSFFCTRIFLFPRPAPDQSGYPMYRLYRLAPRGLACRTRNSCSAQSLFAGTKRRMPPCLQSLAPSAPAQLASAICLHGYA